MFNWSFPSVLYVIRGNNMEFKPGTIVVAHNVELFETIGGRTVREDAMGIVVDARDGMLTVAFSPFITDKHRQEFKERDVVPLCPCDISPAHVTEPMLGSFFKLHLGQTLVNLGEQIQYLEKLAEPEIEKTLQQDNPTATDLLRLIAAKVGISCHERLSPITALAGRIFQLKAFLQH